MPVQLRIDGMAEFKALLRQLPEDLRADGAAIVMKHTDEAEATIRSNYAAHRRSGNLAAGLYRNTDESRFGVRIILRNRAPHAYLFEVGTELRKGGTGRMPAAKVFIPAATKARRAMREDLIALLERNGLTVSGG